MALPSDWQTQLWATTQRLQIDKEMNLNSPQTYAPPPQQITRNHNSLTTNNDVNYFLSHNYTTENFDALGLELTCYNEQSLLGHLITMLLYSIVCIVGLFGNTLVIYVVIRFTKMQTVTNIYILNLAIADECFLIGIPFLLYTMQMGSWQFGEYVCKAYMVSTSITQFTSSIFLLIMAADRYIAVCHPISSPRYRTQFVSKIVSCFAWLTSAIFMLPVILFANSVQVDDHVSCNIKWPEGHNGQTDSTFIWYTLLLGFAMPLLLITGFYFLVIRKLHSVELKHKSKEKKRSHRKVTKLVLTVITVYILCWTPYWIAQLILIYTKVERCASALEILIFLMVGCLGYSNSAMNPLLYAFLSDNFKKSFLRAFSCTIKRKDGLMGEQQVERSMLPKWAKRDRRSQCDDDADMSGNRENERNDHCKKYTKHYSSKHSRFIGTSTAGGTGMTATSIVDDPNSDLTPMEALEVIDSVVLVNANTRIEKSSYGNVQECAVNGFNKVRPPVLQTDL